MKNQRHGQAAVLTEDQMTEILAECDPKYAALFGVCYYTGCRISEAIQLQATDLVGGTIVFRASTTKTKQTREVPISSKLQALLEGYGLPATGPLFPGRNGGVMTTQAADLMLRKICDYLGFKGVSTHSFRRTALTRMSAAGVPLRDIQSISGHASLATLQRYLEVSETQKKSAIAVL